MKVFTILLSLFCGSAIADLTHTVQPNEHLTGILKNYRYSIEDHQQLDDLLEQVKVKNSTLFARNSIDHIEPGMKIILPTLPKKRIPTPTVQTRITFDRQLPIGEITHHQGDVYINRHGQRLTAKSKNFSIYKEDTIETAIDATANLHFSDNGRLNLGPSSYISIEEYQYRSDQPANNKSLIRVFRGAVNSVSGLIGKLNPNNVKLKTAVATIGIRGTEYTLRHCEGQECGDYQGSSVAVTQGQVVASAGDTQVALKPGEFVVADQAGSLSDVTEIPAGFLDLQQSVNALESPLRWWEQLIEAVQTLSAD